MGLLVLRIVTELFQKSFMVNFLKKHAYDDDLAQWVKARTPWKEKQRGDALSVKPQSIEQLNYAS